MAALVFKDSGNQYPIDPEGVERLVADHTVTGKRGNGAQTQFNFYTAEFPFAVVANAHSEAHEALERAYQRDRKAAKAAAR